MTEKLYQKVARLDAEAKRKDDRIHHLERSRDETCRVLDNTLQDLKHTRIDLAESEAAIELLQTEIKRLNQTRITTTSIGCDGRYDLKGQSNE